MVYDTSGNVICDDVPGGETYTDSECKTAFLTYMNKKATALGMSGTSYASPSGQTQSSYSTPQDALKLGVAFCANPKALEIWSTPSQSFAIRGDHARTASITNNVISGVATDLGAYYKFLGGKGGSLIYSNYHRAQILLVEVEGRPTLLSLMALGSTYYNNIFKSAKELADMVKAAILGQTPSEGTNLSAMASHDGGYAACIVPDVTGAYVNLESPSELLTLEYAQNNHPTVSRYPASTSKVMTTLLALEWWKDLKDPLVVKSSDIESGSGSTYYAGDIIVMEDALKIMMMESSNTLANAIARAVGFKILSYTA